MAEKVRSVQLAAIKQPPPHVTPNCCLNTFQKASLEDERKAGWHGLSREDSYCRSGRREFAFFVCYLHISSAHRQSKASLKPSLGLGAVLFHRLLSQTTEVQSCERAGVATA